MPGLTVLVTRPSPEGDALCDELQSVGMQAIHLPVIAFAPPSDIMAYEQAISRLDKQDWAIFISPHAVSIAMPTIRERWPVLPAGLKLAAVGEGTAAALQAAGVSDVLFPPEAWHSEGLLALPAFQSVTGQSIAVVRGEGGRELIDRMLAERGAKVLSILAYRRVLPVIDRKSVLQKLQAQRLDAIICTSAQAVHHLKTLTGAAGWDLIRDAMMIVMSNRVKLVAEEQGFRRVLVTKTASHRAIIDLILRRET